MCIFRILGNYRANPDLCGWCVLWTMEAPIVEQFEQVLGMVDKLSVILILAINWMNERRERLELQARMINRLEALERDKDRDIKATHTGL